MPYKQPTFHSLNFTRLISASGLILLLLNGAMQLSDVVYAAEAPPEAPPSRIYIWQSTDAIPIISGTPPPWYRNERYPVNHSPPVLVYEEGERIDDTREAKPYTESQQLRQAALAHQQALAAYETWANRSYAQRKAEAIEKKLTSGAIDIDMTLKQVESTWGTPQRSQRGLTSEQQPYETWFYNDGRQVRFVGGQVESFTAVYSTGEDKE